MSSSIPTPIALLAIALFTFGCQGRKEKSSQAFVTIGSEQIHEEDLRLELLRQPPGDPDTRRENALNDLVRRKRMVSAAKAAGIGSDPDVQRAFDSLLIQRFMERELQPQLDEIFISEQGIRTYYEANSLSFTTPSTKTFAILFRRSHPSDTANREKHRSDLIRAVERAESLSLPPHEGFGEISVSSSEHQASRFRGGLLDPLRPNEEYSDFRSSLLDAADSLSPGGFSEVIERAEGLYVLRVAEVSPARPRPLEAVRTSIHRKLLADFESDIRTRFHRDLENRFPGDIHNPLQKKSTHQTTSFPVERTRQGAGLPQPSPAFPES